MKLYSCYYTFPGSDNRWDRMAEVLRRSCERYMVRHTVEKLPAPQLTRALSLCANHDKLKVWNEKVQESTEPLILIDADTFLQRDPSPAFDLVRNVGITYRDQEGPKIPLNAGVVYVQPTETAKAFFRAWVESDAVLYGDIPEFGRWVRKYCGLNQSSLGRILETQDWPIDRLNCSTWNLVEPWADIDEAAVVHIKGEAMGHIFDDRKSKFANLPEVKRRWIEMESQK